MPTYPATPWPLDVLHAVAGSVDEDPPQRRCRFNTVPIAALSKLGLDKRESRCARPIRSFDGGGRLVSGRGKPLGRRPYPCSMTQLGGRLTHSASSFVAGRTSATR